MQIYTVRKIYKWFHQSIPTIVFSVGYRGENGWVTHSEYDNREEAKAMCNYLNGGKNE